MEGPHYPVPMVKMADALASYISDPIVNYSLQIYIYIHIYIYIYVYIYIYIYIYIYNIYIYIYPKINTKKVLFMGFYSVRSTCCFAPQFLQNKMG